jgi:hypothetical protein
MRSRWLVAGWLALAVATPRLAPAQSSGFTGAYRLTVTFGPACRASIPSVSLSLQAAEQPVAAGTEVDARPALAGEAALGEVTLLRAGTAVHGPFGTRGTRGDREFVTSREGHLFLAWLVLDGTVTTGSGRPLARGSAFGFVSAGRSSEGYPSSLASCTVADYTWALDPE